VTMDENDAQKVIAKEKIERVTAPSMVPLFSKRSLLIIAVGLIAGLLIALGYWIISPSLSSSGTTSTDTGTDSQSSGLLGILGIKTGGPYESQLVIQVVSPGSEYLPLATLQQRAEYYAAKSHSLPFFKFLSQELSLQMPGFSANVDTLNKTVTTAFDVTNELPIIKVKVTAPTEKEALSLAELIPQDFRDYLIAEEKDQQQKQYDSTNKEIDSVKAALYQAQQELDTLQPTEVLDKNPDYLFLKAKADALQRSLDAQTAQLSLLSINGTDLQVEYDSTVDQMKLISAKIDEVNSGLLAFTQQSASGNDTSTVILDAKIKALQTELDRTMTGYTQTGGVYVAGLAEMISNGDTTSKEYTTAVSKVEATSKALVEAKNERNNILNQYSQNQTISNPDYQVLQIKISTLNAQQTTLRAKVAQLYQQLLNSEGKDTQAEAQTLFSNTNLALIQAKKDLDAMEKKLGYNRLSSNLDVKIAQDKVDNLNSRLETLTKQLGSLVGGNANLLQTDYLVAGNPSHPFPVLPERARAKNTLMMGAIFGVVLAWGALNNKWIIKSIRGLGSSRPQEEVKEE
jgi:hypothetical protein